VGLAAHPLQETQRLSERTLEQDGRVAIRGDDVKEAQFRNDSLGAARQILSSPMQLIVGCKQSSRCAAVGLPGGTRGVLAERWRCQGCTLMRSQRGSGRSGGPSRHKVHSSPYMAAYCDA
jgi:hypothetical protein